MLSVALAGRVSKVFRPLAEMRAVSRAPSPVTDPDIEWLASRRAPAHGGVETPTQSLAARRDEDAV